MPEKIRQMASQASKCRDPVTRRHLRKVAQKTRREFEAGKEVLPRGTVITKLSVNGRDSEDRDEWTEEVRAHCERCYDDKDETLEVQAERIRGAAVIVMLPSRVGRITRTTVNFTYGGHGNHGVVKKQLDFFMGLKEPALCDVPPEPGEDTHLGPLSCDHPSGWARSQNKEGRQGLGRMDSRVRRGVLGTDLLPHEDHNIAAPGGNDEIGWFGPTT